MLSSLWLLSNVFKNTAVLMQNLESQNALKNGKTAFSLGKVSNATTTAILKEVGIDNCGEDEFDLLRSHVKAALTKIDTQISFDLMVKFRKRPQENYQAILEEDGFVFTTQVTEQIITDQIQAISQIDVIKQVLQDKSRHVTARTAISQLHRDKQPDVQSAFTRLPTQEFSGPYRYEAQRSTGQVEEVFMLKRAAKAPAMKNGADTRSEHWNTASFVNEFLMSSLYRRVLYNRAPIIAPVRATAQTEVLLRSKYLSGFRNASKYTGGARNNEFGTTRSLANISGGAKLMAALLAFGEHDIHPGNIGIMKIWNDRKRRITRTFAKIDHGWSATQMFTSGDCMWKNFHSACNVYNYIDNIKIDLSEFRESLEQILMITPSEIEDHIKARVYELEQMGFDPRGLQFPEWTDNTDHNHETSPPSTFSYDTLALLEGRYIERFKKHWEALRQFKAYVEAAEKMTKRWHEPETDWIKSEWIKYLNGANPIKYALDNKLQIDGKDPIIYALTTGLSIDGQDLVTYAAFNRINIGLMSAFNYAISNSILIGGVNPKAYVNISNMDPIIFAHLNGIKIHNRDALEYATVHAIKIAGFDPIEYAFIKDWQINQKTPLEFAALNGIKIKGYDPIVYARQRDKKIKMKEPVEFAILNNLKIKKLDPIIYAIAENISINKKNPLEYAIINGIKIEGTDPIVYAQNKGWLINKKTPLEYAVINGIKIKGMDPIMCAYKYSLQIAGLHPITYAVKNGINIGGVSAKKYEQIGNQDPIVYAHKQQLLIEGIRPMTYAVLHSIQIEGQDPKLYAQEKGIEISSESKVNLPSDRVTPPAYTPAPRMRSESCPLENAIALRELRRSGALNPQTSEETKIPHSLPPRYPRKLKVCGNHTASLSQQETITPNVTTLLNKSEAPAQQHRSV